MVEEPLNTGCWFDDRGGPTFIETVGSAAPDGLFKENEDSDVDNGVDNDVEDDSDCVGIVDVCISPLPSGMEVVLATYRLWKRARNYQHKTANQNLCQLTTSRGRLVFKGFNRRRKNKCGTQNV